MKSKRELTSAQKWEQATLAGNFIFCKVMTANPDLCKELLELLLGIEIDRIEQPLAEHSLKTDYNSKGIRFDVYVKDGTGRCFDIEVQTTNRKNLARRARYYQNLMDVDTLESGADYDDLALAEHIPLFDTNTVVHELGADGIQMGRCIRATLLRFLPPY